MNNSVPSGPIRVKVCPRCGQPSPLDAQWCAGCRHTYRTRFGPVQGFAPPPEPSRRGQHNVGAAVLCAVLLPGLGQAYNRQKNKGLAILLTAVVLGAFTFGLGYALVWLFALTDAHKIAHKIDRGEAVGPWDGW